MPDYQDSKTDVKSAADRLAFIFSLLQPSKRITDKNLGRNLLTRTLDAAFALVRKYLPPVHWLGAALTATIFFFYAHVVAITARLVTTGERTWPDIPTPSVLALWHRDAPSLLVAFAKRRPRALTAIMVSRDPRGDYLAMLCRMAGLRVARGDSEEGGWDALVQLSHELADGACVILTADGGGPARVAKVGAVALASATGVPLIAIAADCHPAVEEHGKWDAARNPVPFCSLTITIGPSRRFDFFEDRQSVEQARLWLEKTLNSVSGTSAASEKVSTTSR